MIRISNKIKTLLAMLSFVQVTSGCDATVQDIIKAKFHFQPL